MFGSQAKTWVNQRANTDPEKTLTSTESPELTLRVALINAFEQVMTLDGWCPTQGGETREEFSLISQDDQECRCGCGPCPSACHPLLGPEPSYGSEEEEFPGKASERGSFLQVVKIHSLSERS